MADRSQTFRPWTPPRRAKPLGLIPFLWVSWRDPLLMWSERHFTEPQLHARGRLGEIIVVSHPEGVRHVLTENAANYEKGALQRRVLGPMLRPIPQMSTLDPGERGGSIALGNAGFGVVQVSLLAASAVWPGGFRRRRCRDLRTAAGFSQ